MALSSSGSDLNLTYCLCHCPFLVAAHRSFGYSTANAFTSLLYVWDKVIIKYRISSRPGPLTPILGNLGFLPGQSVNWFLCWQPSRPSPIWLSLNRKGLKSLGELSSLSCSFIADIGYNISNYVIFTKGWLSQIHHVDLTLFEELSFWLQVFACYI